VNYFVHHWGYPEIAVLAVLVIGVHERVFGPQRPLHTGARPNQTAPDVARLRRHYGRDAQRRVALQYWSMEYFWCI